MTIQKISVLGGGAWGTALALTCARAGRDVTLWEHDAANADSLETKRESRFLPGVKLDGKIKVTRDLQRRAGAADAILLVVPAQVVRGVRHRTRRQRRARRSSPAPRASSTARASS